MRRMIARLLAAASGSLVFPDSWVRFTTTGSTFNPTAECASGVVAWKCEETGQILTGLSPTFSWGSSSTRHVRMGVIAGSGLAGIKTVNLGYNHLNDAGAYGPTPTGGLQAPTADYDKAAQACSAVEDIDLCSGLKNFLAANGNLAGALDFTGCADLEYIECYSADVQAVTLTGCTSLIRLQVEGCNLTTLDLNPVAECLYDLRSGSQQGGTLTFVTLTADMDHLYHFCVVYQIIVNAPSPSRFPLIEELWMWETQQSGALDFTGCTAARSIECHGNAFTSISNLTATTLTGLHMYGNSLNQAAVDSILDQVEALGTIGDWKTVNLTYNNRPSAAGLADMATLQARNWTVTVADAPTVGVNSDDFGRADCTGLENVGNEWFSPNSGDGDISSGDFVFTTSGYQTVLNPGSSLTADYSVTAIIPHATRGNFFGLAGRWNGYDGVRILFYSPNVLAIGSAINYGLRNVTVYTDAGYPASWDVDQDHTIVVTFTGTTVEVYLDGQETRGFYATVPVNATLTDTGYGFCGEGNNRHWESIAAA